MTCECGPLCKCKTGFGLLASAVVALGLLGAGYFISTTVYKGRANTNVVSVKGVAERDAKSDLALWQMSFNVSGNDLTTVYEKVSANEALLTSFLVGKGIPKADIMAGNLKATDRLAEEYGSDNVTPEKGRYFIKTTINVRTGAVDVVEKSSRELGELVKQGIAITSNAVDYQFTKLNDVKPDMLTEATQNARKAAQKFADDSGSKVGDIKEANQGYFSIVSADAANEASENEGSSIERTSSVTKKIRVVVTMTYYLNK